MNGVAGVLLLIRIFLGCLQSKINTLHTESSGEPGTMPREDIQPTEVPLQPIQDSVRLLDANQIFQPLLSGLGVMPQQLRFTTMSDSSNNVSIFMHSLLKDTYF